MQERGAVPPLTANASAARASRWPHIAGAAAVAVVADQLTKWWALETLGDGRVIDLVGSLRFNLALNPGGAFSVGRDYTQVFVVAGFVLLAGLLVWGRWAVTRPAAIAVGLIVGGALGNLTDRVLRDLDGRVVDFIDVQWWPVFNVADIALFCGGALMILTTLREPKETEPADG